MILNNKVAIAYGPRTAVKAAALTATLGLAAASWVVAVRQMNGMDMGVATPLGSFPFFVAVWVSMMAAMMLPGATPAVLMATFAGRSFWARTRTAITDMQVTRHDAQRHQHQHQSDARADAVEPELESRADALAAAPPEVPLERRDLVDTCNDRNRAGDERPVRPVERIHGDAHDGPDGKVRRDE